MVRRMAPPGRGEPRGDQVGRGAAGRNSRGGSGS
jgi:hypothetical protein